MIKPIFEWLKGRESAIEAFIHLGACSSTVETDASYLLENNYRFSVQLADYALTNGQRFIYASSAATYGDGALGFSDQEDQLQSLKPLNMYGYSKHLFDLWLKNQGVLDQVVGLKYFNVFGPNETHKDRMASAIIRMLPAAQKKEWLSCLLPQNLKNIRMEGKTRFHLYQRCGAYDMCVSI